MSSLTTPPPLMVSWVLLNRYDSLSSMLSTYLILSSKTLSNQKTDTPIEALAKQGLVKAAITSYKISRVADGKNDGEITFGYASIPK